MDREAELYFLKNELENVIQGMALCKSILSREEREHLDLHRRCLSELERIKPAEGEEAR